MKTCIWLVLLVSVSQISNAQLQPNALSAFPNPFETTLHIAIDVQTDDTASLSLVNILGQTTAQILTDTFLTSGAHQLEYNGNGLAAGIYFLKLELTQNSYLYKVVKQQFTGSHQPGLTNQTLLSPNPTTGFLSVPIQGKKSIFISNQHGFSETIETDATVIGLHHLHPGLYIIQVLELSSRQLTRGIIVKTN